MQLPDERVTTQRTNERTNERWKEGRKEGELGRKRERRNSYREKERALNSIRPETNNSGLCWIDTRISFPIAVYARSGQQFSLVAVVLVVLGKILSNTDLIFRANISSAGDRPALVFG